jgi:cyclopropane fatty-acyl-phospholipid synthase-like methyltransferase
VAEPRHAQDPFGRQADKYARYRPRYPAELFAWLAETCPRQELAWDCATGNGQAAVGLAAHFDHVVATDISARQLEHAQQHPRIEYRTAPAHDSGLARASVDLVTVATALHWLDVGTFYSEVRRVTRRGGLLAAWTYFDAEISPEIDPILIRYRRDVVGDYWAFEVSRVFERYRTIEFPFDEVAAPVFVARANWTLTDLLGFLESWSATQRYMEARLEDPRNVIAAELRAAWRDAAVERAVEWPLFMRVGRVSSDANAGD